MGAEYEQLTQHIAQLPVGLFSQPPRQIDMEIGEGIRELSTNNSSNAMPTHGWMTPGGKRGGEEGREGDCNGHLQLKLSSHPSPSNAVHRWQVAHIYTSTYILITNPVLFVRVEGHAYDRARKNRPNAESHWLRICLTACLEVLLSCQSVNASQRVTPPPADSAEATSVSASVSPLRNLVKLHRPVQA